jgi:hypothetical protein
MKAFSRISKSNLTFLAAVTCVVLAGAIAAFAVPVAQVFRYTNSPVTFTGVCCSFWGESVSITEPKAVAPVLVTFNADYQATAEGNAGISLNGGECNIFFGSNRLPEFNLGSGGNGSFGNASYQWVVNPSDGLKAGKNTFELCGGGSEGESSTIVLGFNTLAVQISK